VANGDYNANMSYRTLITKDGSAAVCVPYYNFHLFRQDLKHMTWDDLKGEIRQRFPDLTRDDRSVLMRVIRERTTP